MGYYKLTRAKEQADDWVGIVDHVVQMGQEKCLLIVGIRLSAVPVEGNYLTHADVEPIAICPVTQSNGKIVYQQLEAARKQTGVPREILSDQGSDLHKGIRQFCQAHPETCCVSDITHKVAAVLKRELGAERAWQEFSTQAPQTIARVQQTALAALAPPRQRRKARWPVRAWAKRGSNSSSKNCACASGSALAGSMPTRRQRRWSFFYKTPAPASHCA